MEALLWIISATLVNSVLGLIGVFSLLLSKKTLEKMLLGLISFSAGTLVGGAFLHLMAEAVEIMPAMNAFTYVIAGFLVFFLVEGYFHWHHCEECKEHPFTRLMIIGDVIHNLIDGLVIAAAFMISIPLGITTTLVIILHEIPQEIGLFGVLIYGGYGRKKSLMYSFLSQLSCVLGGIAGYLLSSYSSYISYFLVPFAAGGFIYIAASDLVPEMHRMYRGKAKRSVYIILTFIIGIALMGVMKFLFNQ